MSTLNCIKLKPEESFYQEEVVHGYRVTTKRKKIWAVELDLLHELDRVCKKYSIRYCVYAGSLLGAIRHKGFIPWDDDFDVCMLREDFEKLMEIPIGEFENPYFLQTPLSDQKYFCSYARLRNSETTAVLKWNPSPEYNNGIYIDIYCMDGYLGDCWKFKIQDLEKRAVRICLNAYNSDGVGFDWKKKCIYAVLKTTICRITPYEKLYEKFKSIVTKYNDTADKYTDASYKIDEMGKWFIRREDMDNLKEVPFEYTRVLIPATYDRVLKSAYGDYMKFPPLDEVDKWHGDNIMFDPDTPYKVFMESDDYEKTDRNI